MAVLVTRPAPDNISTARVLRAQGYRVLLAPLLQVEPVAFELPADERWSGVLATSAHALRALAGHAALASLTPLPLFAVGTHTAEAARATGFSDIASADGDAAALRELVLARRGKTKAGGAALLYLAGETTSRDLASELGDKGVAVTVRIVYRMAAAGLPPEISQAFADHGIAAVLHYSARSARAFLDATRQAGVEISALALPQVCLSDQVARVLREAGASRLAVADRPQEPALVSALGRLLGPADKPR